MLYNVTLVSAVHQSESVIHIHITLLFLISFPFMSPDSSVGKESACNAGDPSLIPGSGRSTGEGKGYLLKVSWAPCVLLGKESACNSGDLGSNPGLGRFPWRRERLPTPVFWPGEVHGLYSP